MAKNPVISKSQSSKKMLLPNTAWLKRNGYEGLVKAMRTNPQLFAHIPQEKA